MLLLQACRLLRSRGYTVEILTPEAKGPDQVEGVRVHRLNLIKPIQARDPRALLAVDRRLQEIIQSFQATVVHSNDMGPLLWFYLRIPPASTPPRPPLIVSVHNVMTEHVKADNLAPSSFTRMGRLLESADLVTAVSHSCLRDTLTLLCLSVCPRCVRAEVQLRACRAGEAKIRQRCLRRDALIFAATFSIELLK